MSILIKGMEMPTRCEDCFCYRNNAEYDYAYCNISSVNVLGHGNARLNNCPLVPVPPHGRLIDADAFKKYITVSFEEVAPELEGGYKWLAERITNDLLKDIDDAPTIIPAEEGET